MLAGVISYNCPVLYTGLLHKKNRLLKRNGSCIIYSGSDGSVNIKCF